MRSLFIPVRQWHDRKHGPTPPAVASRFSRDEDGATAVEFALVAAPFFGMLFVIISIAHFFWTGASLEDAVQEAGRQIRVGRVEAAGMGQGEFKDFICTYLTIPKANCLESILIDVESSPSLAGLSTNAPEEDNEQYNPGDGADYVIVKATLPITAFNSLFDLLATSNDDKPNRFVLTSVTAFRNEPFN
ncbi:TadE-like protein [Cohaesibacter sp. ES.047]|uniref:TadE/TadG family type IV pilus assembly protein n=1 Tax=Cohaesibacter sp. ES.047 TaxID=1798205 RepID=UPI000BB842A8|nr:TadE/TadG family type IV pilus assembly protein [Cohaesibacter sp. ES.047]SNY91818.1 TadE-like protein [Cohaesibacter sp. ES.047]